MGDLTSYTFKKEERLSHYKLIDELFSKGKKIHSFPFLIIYHPMILPTEYPCQVLFSISKKRVRKAVGRNLIKRKLKEAYRTQKHFLYQALSRQQQQYAFGFIYLETKPLSFQELEEKMKATLKKLSKIDELVIK